MSEMVLIEAAKKGDHAEAERLIKSGADLNVQDDQGWTALNYAAGKGDLALVQLLVENGADFFKTGRDQRTPYMIALAAGRVTVAKYLREVEDAYSGEKPARLDRQYCKAYYLRDLRQFQGWTEGRTNWNNKDGDNNPDEEFAGERIVFIHQDLTVTESARHNENVIFNSEDEAWKEFCATSLNFRVLDDFDLVVPNEASA